MCDRYEGMCVSLPVVLPASNPINAAQVTAAAQAVRFCASEAWSAAADIAEEAKAAETAAAAKRRRFSQRLKPSGTKIDVS